MKIKIGVAVLTCFLLLSPSLYAQTTWDLGKDLGQTSNQISFNEGSNQDWYLMESVSRVHDPTLYRFLTQYQAQCQSTGSGYTVNGVGCWHGTESNHAGSHLKTEIAFNFTKELQDVVQDVFAGYQPHATLITATWERFAIVAWRSPFTGTARITGEFGWRNFFKATEANWFLDKGSTTLQSGRLFGGGFKGPVNVGRMPIRQGEVLYFIVDDFNFEDCFCANPVDFRVAITQVP